MSDSLFTTERFEAILDKISTGTPLAVICREPGQVTPRTVRNWMKDRVDLQAQYQEARDDGFDAIAAECLEIANTPLPGVAEKWEWVIVGDAEKPEAKPKYEWRMVEKQVADMIQHRKLQIETRLKLLAKWDPKRYGERMNLNHEGHLSLEQLVTASHKPAGAVAA